MKLKHRFYESLGRVKTVAIGLARTGTSPRRMAACIAVGICIGIFPILGTTTILCAAAAFALRLNQPLIQIANYVVYPLQILLLVPFYTAGNWLFGGQLPAEAGRQLVESFGRDGWSSLLQVGDLTLYAIIAWLMVTPAAGVLLYRMLKPVMGNLHAVAHQASRTREFSNTADLGNK